MSKINPLEVLLAVSKVSNYLINVDQDSPADMAACAMALDALHAVEREKFQPKIDYQLRKMLKEHPEFASQLPPGEAEKLLSERDDIDERPRDTEDPKEKFRRMTGMDFDDLLKKGPRS